MANETTALGTWLEAQLERRQLSQMNAAAEMKIGVSTINDILRRGHIPRVRTLLRLADYFDTPREQVLRLAAGLPAEPGLAEPDAGPEQMVLLQQLLQEFRRLPDEWKPHALQQIVALRRLSELPSVRIIGAAEEEPHGQESTG